MKKEDIKKMPLMCSNLQNAAICIGFPSHERKLAGSAVTRLNLANKNQHTGFT